MPSEWAMAKAERTAESWWANEEEAQKIPWIQFCAEALDAARSQGRREGPEEAAQVADGHAEHGEFWHAGRYDCAEYIALDIRARINQEPTA